MARNKLSKDDFTRYFALFEHHSEKKVKSIEFKLISENVSHGDIYITDLQLQEGTQATGEIPNTKDFFKKTLFNIDESHNSTSYENVYLGQKPRFFKKLSKRFFNIVGRGFETIVISNVYHEDYRIPLLTTGLDLTLYPKDDYDFLRVSTLYGGYIEDEFERTYKDDSLADNPLNKRYTREFCFGKGKTGDEIKILASKRIATLNGKVVPLGVRRFHVGEEVTYNGIKTVYYKNRQRFMMLPAGSTRINIQFMKKTNKDGHTFMVDDGIGFYGLAEFDQWTWGVSKI